MANETNEEKARKLVEQYETRYNDTRDLLWTDLEDIAIQMAQWKDEQYAKVLAPILIELDELKQQVKSLLP